MSIEQKTINNKHQQMVIEILHTAEWLDAKISLVLSQVGITHPQFNILRILEASFPGTMSVGCIKEKILFKKSDLTRLIDRLEDKKLVSRKICPANRRKMDILITKQGLNLIDSLLPKLSVSLNGYFNQTVTPPTRDVIIQTLQKIRKEEH